MINSIRTNTLQYQANQQGLARRRTLVNALDTIDAKSGKYRTVADDAQRAYLAFPSMLTMLPAFILAFMSEKHGGAKLAVPTALLSGLSALAFGIFAKNRGENSYKTISAGQAEALKDDLSDPKLFVNIDAKRIREINNNPNYKKIISSKMFTDRANLFLDYNYKEYKEFFRDIDKKTKEFESPKEVQDNETSKAIDFIDKRARNYNNKIVTGMYLLYSGLCAAGAGTGIALNSIAKKNNKFSIPLNIGAFASILTPMFMLCKISQKSFFSDIEQISRLKAKEDFLNDKYEDKNSLQTYFDYNKSKNKYIQKLEKQEYITSMRNSIIKKSAADKKEIADAEVFQQEFKSAINAKDRMNKLKKAEINNSTASDFIINVFVASVLYPILVLLNRKLEFGAGKTSSLIKIGALETMATSVGCMLSAGLSKFLNKKSDS